MKQEDCCSPHRSQHYADASQEKTSSEYPNQGVRLRRSQRSSKKIQDSLDSQRSQNSDSNANAVTSSASKKKKRDRHKTSNKKRPSKSGRTPTRGTALIKTVTKPVTKAGIARNAGDEPCTYADLFGDEDQDDENVDAGDDDSEYAPSDEEVARRLSGSSKRRKGASAGTRRHSKTKSSVELDEGGSTDEDEAGESESDDDDEEEDEFGDTAANGSHSLLFTDENNQTHCDVYDFDAQSILSDKRATTIKKRLVTANNGRTAGAPASRSTRRSTQGAGTSWGSNIYSALSTALKTRADLDAYSSFLKLTALNGSFDHLLTEICKPSNQHTHIFYGASASLQSLMGRINDHDKVVELLHACVSRSYDQLQHRVVCLVPIVHQPLFGISHLTPAMQMLDSLSRDIDREMVIRPAYLLDQETNLLAIPSSVAGDFGVSNTQYNLITGQGNIGRYVPDLKQLVVSSDLYQKLTDLVALPPERIYELALAKAHQQADEADIDISPLEPPNLQRIVVAVDGKGDLIGLALLDTWDRKAAPLTRHPPPIALIDANGSQTTGIFGNQSSSKETDRQTISDQVREVLYNIIDWVILKSDPKDFANTSKRDIQQKNSILGQLYFMDAFLVKPNGRRDALLLVACRHSCHPTFESVPSESENFSTYVVLDESRFALEKHGFTPEMPIALDGVHTVDVEEILEDKSLLVVPDLLYDTLRKVLLRELMTSSGTPTAAAVVTNSRSDFSNLSLNNMGPSAVIRCAKFVILDKQRRVPLAVAFDSPVRLTLQVCDDKLGVHPFGEAASSNFDQVTPSELKALELSFRPTTAEYRLVAINGLLFGLQMDDRRVIRRVLEIVPARFDHIYPNVDRPSVCAQSAVGNHQSCPSNVRIVNDESNSSTVLPAFYYPYCEQNGLANVISGLSDHLCSWLFKLPVQVSLYDVVLRIAQKYMPEILAKQHIEAAEAAAYAEAAANPHAPPPAPVPLPEHWGVCCLCAKELRSPNGLLDHEMRHLGLSRFRCGIHNICFLDRRSWQLHMNEYHVGMRSSSLPSALPRTNVSAQTDSGSDQDYEEDEATEIEDTPGSGLLAGLANVFNTGLLVGRMEAPQCEKCGDYFPAADVLAQHLDFCDGVSFCVRTPIPRAAASANKVTTIDESTTSVTDTCSADPGVATNVCELSGEIRDDNSFVCGICGVQVSSHEKVVRHFTTYHLQCILCNKVLRSIEELSCHYHVHLTTDVPASQKAGTAVLNDDNAPTNAELVIKGEPDAPTSTLKSKSLLHKLITCDICTEFYGTKYNYYFHQWAEHGVVHPPVGSVDGVPQVIPQPRHFKRSDREDGHSNASVRRIKCKFCGMVVRVTGKDYVNHLSDKHSVRASPDMVCRICADVFESQERLSAHLGETHAPSGEYVNAGVQTIFRCSYCEFWGFFRGLLRHSREVHGDLTPAMYECIHCYERFTDKRVWRAHLDKHNEGYAHRCMECGRAFRLRSSLMHHVRTHHGDDQGPSTCDYCGLTYPKRSSLRYHIFRMHNQELAHECFMCQRRFRLETELRRHVKEMHSGAVKCEICHKVCTNLRCYAQHRQKHFRTRIYQCTDCQTTFKSKLAMKRHIRVEHLQLGPEKFECQICGKIVTQIGMHMLIHKEARFECEYCGKRFTKAAYYNEHLRIHRGEQPFECHICRKRFNKKSNLNVHLRFHEKHRDEEGNYLELKPRGRISTIFGDAQLSPSDRAARQAAARAGLYPICVPRVDASVGSDFPGAFNCTGPAGAAAEAASRVADLYGLDGAETNHVNSTDFLYDSVELEKVGAMSKRQRLS